MPDTRPTGIGFLEKDAKPPANPTTKTSAKKKRALKIAKLAETQTKSHQYKNTPAYLLVHQVLSHFLSETQPGGSATKMLHGETPYSTGAAPQTGTPKMRQAYTDYAKAQEDAWSSTEKALQNEAKQSGSAYQAAPTEAEIKQRIRSQTVANTYTGILSPAQANLLQALFAKTSNSTLKTALQQTSKSTMAQNTVTAILSGQAPNSTAAGNMAGFLPTVQKTTAAKAKKTASTGQTSASGTSGTQHTAYASTGG